MHEVALAQSIVDLVEDQARRDSFTRVSTVHISLGALSRVDPQALDFGFEVAARGTVAEGAKLAIDRPGGMGFCTACSKNVAVDGYGDACPACGGYAWLLIRGDEMRVVDLEVE
jgi:hydrogenase nickel incorporation protein HypA/HybF